MNIFSFFIITSFFIGTVMATEQTQKTTPLPVPATLAEKLGPSLDTLQIKNFHFSKEDIKKIKSYMNNPVSYVTEEKTDSSLHYMLHKPSKRFLFPLSEEDRNEILRLIAAFLKSPNCAGLAAPQIGIHRSATIYAIGDEAKSLRKDFTEEVPITLLLNASYTALTEEKATDWEGCFSVESFVGEVERPIFVRVDAYDGNGKPITFEAKGFEARVTQHEIDHLFGILFSQRMTEKNRKGTLEEVRALRLKEMEKVEVQ